MKRLTFAILALALICTALLMCCNKPVSHRLGPVGAANNVSAGVKLTAKGIR